MNTLGVVVVVLGALGGLSGIATLALLLPNLRKLRADTRKSLVDADAAQATADDEHMRTIVQVLVTPLRDEVTRLHAEVTRLRDEVETLHVLRRRYLRLLDWARAVLAWARNSPIPPPWPPVPIDVVEDL